MLGIQEGLASQNGKALLHTVRLLRLVQPALVLFEQVAGFRQHQEFEAFVQAMNEAGFRIAVARVHDLALLTHCTRRLCFYQQGLCDEVGPPGEMDASHHAGTSALQPPATTASASFPQKHSMCWKSHGRTMKS